MGNERHKREPTWFIRFICIISAVLLVLCCCGVWLTRKWNGMVPTSGDRQKSRDLKITTNKAEQEEDKRRNKSSEHEDHDLQKLQEQLWEAEHLRRSQAQAQKSADLIAEDEERLSQQ